MVVKGSKQYQVKVVKYRPGYWWLLGLVLVLLAAAAVAGSYWLGHREGIGQQKVAIAERDRLRAALGETKTRLEQTRQQLTNLKLGAQVDQKANEEVRNEVTRLKQQIAELEEDISFYRGLMAPTGNKRGLTIGSLNIVDSAVPRRYQYKLVVQQLAVNHGVLNGYINFNIIGRMGEQRQVLALKDVSPQVDSENIKLRFKYFQNIEGELSLPEGFEPERIELVARSIGRDSVVVEKNFGWLVAEN